MVDLVVLGAPGAGKGTQVELLTGWLPLPAVATGDLFRAALKEGTPLGLAARGYMDRGELVPDDVTVGMVAERISQSDCADGVIFDGFPRTVTQAERLDVLLHGMRRQVDQVLYLRVTDGVLLERLAGRWMCRECGGVFHRVASPEKVRGICDDCGGALYQREDDAPETQRRRIEVYLEQTAPLQSYYGERGLLVEIDGNRPIDKVQRDLREAIAPLIKGSGLQAATGFGAPDKASSR